MIGIHESRLPHATLVAGMVIFYREPQFRADLTGKYVQIREIIRTETNGVDEIKIVLVNGDVIDSSYSVEVYQVPDPLGGSMTTLARPRYMRPVHTYDIIPGTMKNPPMLPSRVAALELKNFRQRINDLTMDNIDDTSFEVNCDEENTMAANSAVNGEVCILAGVAFQYALNVLFIDIGSIVPDYLVRISHLPESSMGAIVAWLPRLIL